MEKRKKTGHRAACLGLAAVLFAALLTGCTQAPSSFAPASSSAAEVPGAVYGMIIKEENNLYMQKMYEGFAMACGEIGATAVLKGPDSYTAQAQIECIRELVAQEVDVILIAANHTDALEEELNLARQKGITVLSIDSSVNPQSRSLHIQQADPEKVGRVLVQAAYSMIEGEGNVAIITSTPHATNQNLWLSWMLRELEENPEKYASFNLLGEFFGEDDYDTTVALTESLLQDYPELDVIITPSAASMPAVGHVLRESGSDVVFTGLGLPSEIGEYIESGICPWMYLWNPIELGYLAAYAAAAFTNGEITGAVGESFSAGSLGTKSIQTSADGGTEVVLANPVKFDENNIELWKTVY